MRFFVIGRAQTVDRAAPLSYLTRVPPLDIITLPDRKLRLVSDPIERVDDDLLRFADQMLETMYDAPGIGLAAIQVGVPRRIIVLDVAQREDETAVAEADGADQPGNPQAFRRDRWSARRAACRSRNITPRSSVRPRSVSATSTGTARRRRSRRTACSPTCVQHEIDHLDGKLFIDYLSKLKRDMVIKKFAKQARSTAKPAAL